MLLTLALSPKKMEMNSVIEPFMYDMHQYHILLLAKNQTGWHNLVKIQSEEEMIESFESQAAGMVIYGCDKDEYLKLCMAAIENTQLIADKVEDNIKLGSDKPLFSNVKVTYGLSPEKWLTQKAFMGMYKYLAKHPEYDVREYESRLTEELEIINSKGFAPYMLAVE